MIGAVLSTKVPPQTKEYRLNSKCAASSNRRGPLKVGRQDVSKVCKGLPNKILIVKAESHSFTGHHNKVAQDLSRFVREEKRLKRSQQLVELLSRFVALPA